MSLEARNPEPYNYSPEFLLHALDALLLPRLFEERMLLLLRQGRISKWFSGIGQEAIAVGATLAMDVDEYILPMHRNLGVFTTRKVPLGRLLAQFQGKAEGFTGGRDRSFHFGSKEHNLVGMISHLGPQLCVADGLALAHKLSADQKATLVFTGEGGTSEGDFHEAVNVAAVWNLPVIFLVENNGYALSTPVTEQFACEQLVDRARGYGVEGITIDGNNILEVFQTVSNYAHSIRQDPRPILIEAMTFRVRGHEEASGVKYVSPALIEEWEAKDPLHCFYQALLERKLVTREQLDTLTEQHQHAIESAIAYAFALPEIESDPQTEQRAVFSVAVPLPVPSTGRGEPTLRFVDAIADGLREAMRAYPELVCMGQDIAEYGGVFKVTEGFLDEFGSERVRNTPLCESAIVGAALGLSIAGFKSMVEMQFSDFATCGFNQIVNNLAKIHYRWGQVASTVIRMPCGAGVGAGPFHSQSTEAWFMHSPGLKVAYPAYPADAKGLLIQSIADPNPVLFFEHKKLYRSISGLVPEGYYSIPFGEAAVVRSGTDVTVVTYGLGVHWAVALADEDEELGVEVIDLRTLVPLDFDTIATSVARTGRVLVLHEAPLTCGVGSEIAARISSELFHLLDAPVTRVGSLDTPVPFAGALEQDYLPEQRFRDAIIELLLY